MSPDAEAIRIQLLEYCVNSALDARESAHPERERIEIGLLFAHALIEDTSLDEDVPAYLRAVQDNLYSGWMQFLTDGADDSANSRALAIRVVLDELGRAANSLPSLPADFMSLVEALLPLAAALHAGGSLVPIAASTDAQNRTHVEGVTPSGEVRPQARRVRDAVMFFLRNFENDFANGVRERALILFHTGAGREDAPPVERQEDGNAIGGWLQRSSGETWQILIPYQREGDRWEYFAPVFYEIERPIASAGPADVLERFLDAYDRQDAAQREAEGDAGGKHERIRQGMVAAKNAVAAQAPAGDLAAYLTVCRQALDGVAIKLALEDVDDEHHWRTAGARALRRDLDRVTQPFTHRLPPELRAQFSEDQLAVSRDFVTLIEQHLPVIKKLDVDGVLGPVAAWLDVEGRGSSQAIQESQSGRWSFDALTFIDKPVS